MINSVTATYEDGVLKPESDLRIPSGTRVRLTVEPLDASRQDEQAAWDELERLCADSPIDSGGEILTRDQLHERN